MIQRPEFVALMQEGCCEKKFKNELNPIVVDAIFNAAHVLAKAKVAVHVKSGELKPFAHIHTASICAMLLILCHKAADVLLHHGLLFKKRAMREGAVQSAPYGDCFFIAS